MKHVSILVPAGKCILSSVVGAYKVFNSVNGYLMQTGQEDKMFKVDLVGISDETVLYDGCFQIKPNKRIEEVDKTDLIIVTTIQGDMDVELNLNRPFVKWMQNQRIENNAELASLCGGAFLLADSGLLNGKTATTHWIIQEEFKNRFPEVELTGEKIITEDNGIYTSGGAYSFLNLLLHLVEKHAGREAAIWCSKLLEIEFDRDSQNEFIIFSGQKGHGDEVILKAQEIIEGNIHDKINVESLADKLALSGRSFIRRFKKATSNTPLEYIQRVKIEAAKKQLESTTKNIGEVMYQVGYSDTKAFRNTFRKYTGMSPIEYRGKYNREMAMI